MSLTCPCNKINVAEYLLKLSPGVFGVTIMICESLQVCRLVTLSKVLRMEKNKTLRALFWGAFLRRILEAMLVGLVFCSCISL